MAFQDNSGDIIFDVVLTDEGRRRLSADDGTFNITKFALGDDEINYTLYDTTAVTQNQDIQILQTPIFEAFTNNTSMMSSMLVSIPRNNLFYLPIVKINEVADSGKTEFHADNVFYVAVDAMWVFVSVFCFDFPVNFWSSCFREVTRDAVQFHW